MAAFISEKRVGGYQKLEQWPHSSPPANEPGPVSRLNMPETADICWPAGCFMKGPPSGNAENARMQFRDLLRPAQVQNS